MYIGGNHVGRTQTAHGGKEPQACANSSTSIPIPSGSELTGRAESGHSREEIFWPPADCHRPRIHSRPPPKAPAGSSMKCAWRNYCFGRKAAVPQCPGSRTVEPPPTATADRNRDLRGTGAEQTYLRMTNRTAMARPNRKGLAYCFGRAAAALHGKRHSDHDPVLRTVRNPRALQPKRLCPALELTGKEDPLGVGLLALCIQPDGLEQLLLNVKKRTAPGGTARSLTYGGGRALWGVSAPPSEEITIRPSFSLRADAKAYIRFAWKAALPQRLRHRHSRLR
jgi:hypothetical protein